MTEEEFIAYEKVVRERSRLQRQLQEIAAADRRRACPHVAGSNPLSTSSDIYGRTSIVWHTVLVDHPPVGICTNCLRIFCSSDSDYDLWRNKQSVNRPSGIKAELPVTIADEEDMKVQTVLSEPIFESFVPNDASEDPRDWSNEKLNKHIDVERQIYKLRRQIAS